MPGTFLQVKPMKKLISRVLMTIILCIMMLSMHRALPTCYQYPRYFGSYANSSYILSIDMHFSTDLLVYVGSSQDSTFNRNSFCSGCDIPVVVAMSIAQPTFKWTLSAVQWRSQTFTDVDISDDGGKVLVAGSGTDAQNQVILWVLNSITGSIISQKVVKLLDAVPEPYPLTSRGYKQALLTSSQTLIYLLLRTNSPNTSIYLVKLDYTASAVTPLGSLQTNPLKDTQQYSQITFGGSSSGTLETTLYVVVPVDSKYKVSRIAEDGAIQWTYEFPLDIANSDKEVFIEYALNAVSNGDNTLVIANAQYYIAVMKISSTELAAAAGPILSSLKLYKEVNQWGVISAIYVKPSSDQVYLLKKQGSYYYIGYFLTTAYTITYKQAFYNCDSEKGFNPRGRFLDETNYYAALNCNSEFDYDQPYYYYYSSSTGWWNQREHNIGTYFYGGQIFASSKSLYQSCYQIPNFSIYPYTMTDQTAFLDVVTPSSAPWQTIASPAVIEVTNDSNNLIRSLSMMHLTQNEYYCSVYPYKGVSHQASTPFINYVSGVSRQFNVLFSATQVCLFGSTTSPTLSYSLENSWGNPTSFMTINPSNGIISISDQSLPSNFNYKVTAKASGIPNGIIVSQDYTLYDLRLYFANVKNATMLSGDIMTNQTTVYSHSSNTLTFGGITLNGTSLRPTPYFIQYDSYSKILTLAPANISHFGVHTLRFKVSDAAGYFYQHVIQVNVRNRAPFFSSNITNFNYSTTFNTIATFALPARVSPDRGSPWVKVISTQNFVSIVGQGTDILMRVHALNFYDDMTVHNVSLELYIPNYPNTTKYWINLRIVNTPPKFDMPLADYDMGLYWNKNYKLPKVIDPDGGQVSVMWGIVTIFDFIKFEPTTNTFTFNPMEVDMIGEYNIMVTLIDHHLGTYSQEFTVRVHRPPMFAVEMKKFFSMKIGSVFEFELPLFETDGIDLSHLSLPGFAIIDKFQYTFKPTTIPHLGVFLIKGKLQNQWGSLTFDFRIEVTNDPPSLALNPKDLMILQDTIFTQALPAAVDPEDQPIKIKMAEAGQKSLPSFITFNPITKEIMLAPTKKTKIGIFMIQVDVYDSMNYIKTYKFLIQVLENTFLNKELKKNNEGKIMQQIMQKKPQLNFQKYQAKLIIQQVTRDGRATLKLAAGAGKTGQLAIQVTNDTFEIKLNRGEKVRYEVGNVIEERGVVEIQLFFANPSNISNKIVSYANLATSLGT